MKASHVMFFASNDEPLEVTDAWRRHCARYRIPLEFHLRWHSWENTGDRALAIRSAALAVIWNGNDPGSEWVARVCRHVGTPYVFAEWGLLPQAGYFHLDPCGIVGASSLCGSLDWVTDAHLAALHAHRESHFGARRWAWRHETDSFVLVPLQLERDSAFYLYSHFESNADFVAFVEARFPHSQIVVRPHPNDPRRDYCFGRATIEYRRSTLELAQFASMVVGLNSTVLLETAMLGVPTTAHAHCPLFFHQDSPADIERLLAACVSRQIPRAVDDLAPWLRSLGYSAQLAPD